MFGMGFAELLIIGIIAILFLGPDKLPETMVQIAKFFKNVKSTISTAKESIEEELHVSELRDQAQNYRQELQEAHQEMARLSSLDTLNDEIDEVKKASKVDMYGESGYADENQVTSTQEDKEVVTFKKKKKKKKTKNKEDLEVADETNDVQTSEAIAQNEDDTPKKEA